MEYTAKPLRIKVHEKFGTLYTTDLNACPIQVAGKGLPKNRGEWP